MTSDLREPLIPRRKVLALALGAVALGTLGACGDGRRLPRERAVSFGFEDIVGESPDWDRFGDRLARCNANAVNLSVGRVEWTAFEWVAHPDAASSLVSETGRDFVAEAVAGLRPHLPRNHTLTLTIDTLVPALIAEDPALAGIAPDGEPSESFASVSALSGGIVGDRIVQLAEEICARYDPDRIALTELMFDDSTFGADDLASYRSFTSRADWPRRPDGRIETQDPTLGQWRSQALTSLLGRVQEVAKAHGVGLDMDVRASWMDPHGNRALSGHDYDLILSQADRITVWNYFALNSRLPQYGAELTRSLSERHPGRFVMSTGLWALEGVIASYELEESLAAVAGAGADAVSVTPASLLTGGHWDALERVWGR